MLGGATISQTGIPRPIYHYSLPLYGGLTLVLYLLSTRLVRTTRRWHINWKDAVIVLALFGLFGGAVALAFTGTAGRYEDVSIFQAPTPFPGMMMEPAVAEQVVVERVVEAVEVIEITPTPFDPTTNGEIYAAVIRQIYITDYFSGNPPEKAILYILDKTDDSIGDPEVGMSDSQFIHESWQKAIAAALSDLSAQVRWVEDRSEVPVEEGGRVADGGVILVLGNPHMQMGGRGTLSASISERDVGGMGKTYIVEYIEGTWQVSGDTGFLWESE
jgi:hypothetical protein